MRSAPFTPHDRIAEATAESPADVAARLKPDRHDGYREQSSEYYVERPPLPLGPQGAREQEPGDAPDGREKTANSPKVVPSSSPKRVGPFANVTNDAAALRVVAQAFGLSQSIQMPVMNPLGSVRACRFRSTSGPML